MAMSNKRQHSGDSPSSQPVKKRPTSAPESAAKLSPAPAASGPADVAGPSRERVMPIIKSIAKPTVDSSESTTSSSDLGIGASYVPTSRDQLDLFHQAVGLHKTNMKILQRINDLEGKKFLFRHSDTPDKISQSIVDKAIAVFYANVKYTAFKNRLALNHEDATEFKMEEFICMLDTVDERKPVFLTRSINKMTWTTPKTPGTIDRMALYKLDPFSALMKWQQTRYGTRQTTKTIFNYVPFIPCSEELSVITEADATVKDMLNRRTKFNSVLKEHIIPIVQSEGLSIMRMAHEFRVFLSKYKVVRFEEHEASSTHRMSGKHLSGRFPQHLLSRHGDLLAVATIDFVRCCKDIMESNNTMDFTEDVWEFLQRLDHSRRLCEVSQCCIRIASNSLSYRSVLASPPPSSDESTAGSDDEEDVDYREYDFLTAYDKAVFRATSVACTIEDAYTTKIAVYCHEDVLRRKYRCSEADWQGVMSEINRSILRDELIAMYTMADEYQMDGIKRMQVTENVRPVEYFIGGTIADHCVDTRYYADILNKLPEIVEQMYR
jgi:hypothetical protein